MLLVARVPCFLYGFGVRIDFVWMYYYFNARWCFGSEVWGAVLFLVNLMVFFGCYLRC